MPAFPLSGPRIARAAVGALGVAVALSVAPVVASDPFEAPLSSAALGSAAAETAAAGRSTLHVSRRGSDAAAGTAGSPLRTVSEAVERARSGDRVVVRPGRYHESVVVPAGKRLDIRGAGRGVWLDGTTRVTGWSATSHGFVHRRWRVEFDSSPTYHWGAADGTEPGWSFVSPDRPMAAHPDQVWIDGRPQRQVGSLAQLRTGTFYVDERANLLHLGSDPRGRTVRASTLAKALSIRGAGTRVSGLGVRGFAPSVPHMGAVTVEATGVTLARMAIVGNATTGLHISSTGARLRAVRALRNGMLGIGATYADGLSLVRVRSNGNNTEGFNRSPVAGGVKVGRTRGIRVRSSQMRGNDGTGLWFDESSYRISVVGSRLQGNAGHGLSLEISARARLVDTIVSDNAGHGVKVNNTNDVELWNNTIVGNGRAVNIVQDDRDPKDRGTPGRDPRQPSPDPTMPWVSRDVRVHNNILSTDASRGNCLLCVEDYSGRFTAEQLRVTASGNVYHQPGRDVRWAVVWARRDDDPAVFTSVSAFRRETGQEERHLATGKPVITPSLRASSRVRQAAPRTAEPLPAGLARLIGVSPGARRLGAVVG